jgi:hypothetical protein
MSEPSDTVTLTALSAAFNFVTFPVAVRFLSFGEAASGAIESARIRMIAEARIVVHAISSRKGEHGRNTRCISGGRKGSAI